MRNLVPFRLDPIFNANANPQVPCADCGKVIEFRYARIVMVDISKEGKDQAVKDLSLDELVLNTVWTILCPERWRSQYGFELESEIVQ
jgi:hypothetical protein